MPVLRSSLAICGVHVCTSCVVSPAVYGRVLDFTLWQNVTAKYIDTEGLLGIFIEIIERMSKL